MDWAESEVYLAASSVSPQGVLSVLTTLNTIVSDAGKKIKQRASLNALRAIRYILTLKLKFFFHLIF